MKHWRGSQLHPTLEEVADLKTAVSEAVTNSIIHGYEGEVHKIEMKLLLTGQEIYVEITDHGKGIEDVEKAMEPMYTTKADKDRSAWGSLLWRRLWTILRWNHRSEKELVCA